MGLMIELILNNARLEDKMNATTLQEYGIKDGTTLTAIKRRRAFVLTASDDETAKIWDASTGECKQTLSGHSGYVFSAVFSADGSSVLTASKDKTAKIWDASTGECKQTLSGHSRNVNSAVFSADGLSVL